MRHLEQIKVLLEIVLLGLFLFLAVHLWVTRGKDHALSLLTNKP